MDRRPIIDTLRSITQEELMEMSTRNPQIATFPTLRAWIGKGPFTTVTVTWAHPNLIVSKYTHGEEVALVRDFAPEQYQYGPDATMSDEQLYQIMRSEFVFRTDPYWSIQSAARRCIRIQDAVNLSGVVHQWAEDLEHVLWPAAHANNLGTAWVNSHPINVAYIDKCASLARCQYEDLGHFVHNFGELERLADSVETTSKETTGPATDNPAPVSESET